MRRVGLVVVSALIVTGCTTGPEPAPSQSPTLSVAPSVSVSPSPTRTELIPPSADPSTAGSLSAATLPQNFLGFTPDVRAPEEGEFVPNGTWVFAAKDPAAAADQTWPRCGTEAPAPPQHVLMGLYANPAGALGVGQTFEFADEATATAWFDAYAADIARCATAADTGFTQVTEQAKEGGVLTDRRLMAGQVWGERVWVDGAKLWLVAVQDDVSLEELRAAV